VAPSVVRLAALCVLALTAAGCSSPTAVTEDEGLVCLTQMSGMPAHVAHSTSFNFTIDAQCVDHDFVSPMVRAFYRSTSVAEPTRDAYTDSAGFVSACPPAQQRSGFPEPMRCGFPDPGTYYVRAFASIPDPEGKLLESWSPEVVVIVQMQAPAAGPGVVLYDLPSRIPVGEKVALTVKVSGVTVTSDHVGAHFDDAPHASEVASPSVYTEPCDHQAATVSLPGTFTAGCLFAAPGTYYLRGHARYDKDGTQNLWTPELTVTVV
jgi:hypothetical protein